MPVNETDPASSLHCSSWTPRPRWPVALLVLAATLAPGTALTAQLQLTWVDNSGGQAGFRIERKADADPDFSELALEVPGVTSYTDATVVAGPMYCYRVQAYDGAGVSAYSNEACGTVATGLALAVGLGGSGQGLVMSSPAGIDCSPTCAATYPGGTIVTLSASPAGGSSFEGWSGGGCSGTDPCTLTGNTAITVGATFMAAAPPPVFTLSVSSMGPGTVTSGPAGIACGSDCSESYGAGTIVTLTAAPANGARFLGWSGGCTGTAVCVVTLDENVSVSATFTKSKKR